MNEIKSYSLKEISEWQSASGDESKITLPNLQRGFVWKPNQIEALWDSIFRGYPIGAILMSIDEHSNRNLLDGQQRCTSIALGHFCPFDENTTDFLSLKEYKPSIWIDLVPRQIVNGRKFIFRCLTQSHPWGYQINGTTLSMFDRRKALDFFFGSLEEVEEEEQKIERYTDLKSKNINPWDSRYPIPLAYILETDFRNEIEFKQILLKKLENIKIKTKYSNNEFVNFNDVTDEEFAFIFKGFCNYKKVKIPEILVDANVLKDDEEELNSDSQDPTLFVRLNSAGTRISGEELNYSIYKAYFPQFKELVEKIGASYLAPSKVISLFSRLSACEQTNFLQYQKDFSIQVFKKKFAENEFKTNLQKNIENSAELIVNQAISILKKEDDKFPIILLKQIIVSNTDLFFVLLAYLKKVRFENLTEKEKSEIASCFVYILWFHKDSKKSTPRLFNLLFEENNNRNWSESLNVLIEENQLIPVVSPSLLKSNLSNILIENLTNFNDIVNIKGKDLLNKEIIKTLNFENNFDSGFQNWVALISRIYHNRTLLIYAQKDYMNSKFKEFNQIESIEDTNKPWDWDHIYPASWVYNKESINLLVKAWVNWIGNFRALSYDDNRSENNHLSPRQRFEFDLKKEESFINKNDHEFWEQIDHSFNRIKHEDIEKTKIFLSAVIFRMVNIYENWYENYFINE